MMVMMIMSGCWFVVMKNAVCEILFLCVLFLRGGHLNCYLYSNCNGNNDSDDNDNINDNDSDNDG